MIGKTTVGVAVLALLAGGGAVALATGQFGDTPDPERARIEGIVRDYILEHPEILPEAMQRLQAREIAKAVDANRAAYETPFAGAWAGDAQGDVVLVEFFDYACGFCRQSNPDVERLLAEDDKLKVVWRELPVLGPDSQVAADASLAAAREGDFREFHETLFSLGRPTAANIAEAKAAVTGAGSPA